MVIWKAAVQDASDGLCLFWATTKSEAVRMARGAIKQGRACDDESHIEPYMAGDPERYEIEPTADALVHWLNVYVQTDNG